MRFLPPPVSTRVGKRICKAILATSTSIDILFLATEAKTSEDFSYLLSRCHQGSESPLSLVRRFLLAGDQKAAQAVSFFCEREALFFLLITTISSPSKLFIRTLAGVSLEIIAEGLKMAEDENKPLLVEEILRRPLNNDFLMIMAIHLQDFRLLRTVFVANESKQGDYLALAVIFESSDSFRYLLSLGGSLSTRIDRKMVPEVWEFLEKLLQWRCPEVSLVFDSVGIFTQQFTDCPW